MNSMDRDSTKLEISLEELSHLTGLTAETIQGDRIDERFRFSFIPKALRPYRYLIYTAFIAILIPLLLQILVIAIALSSVLLLIFILYSLVVVTQDQSKYQERELREVNTKQQKALKSLILRTQEHNLLVKNFHQVDALIDVNHSSNDAIHQEVTRNVLLLCREQIIVALELERQLREGLVDASKTFGNRVLHILSEEIQAGGAHRGSSEAVISASVQLLGEMDEKRESLRDKFDTVKLDPSIYEQQVAQAKASRYGRVLNPSIQNLLNVQRDIFSLLND